MKLLIQPNKKNISSAKMSEFWHEKQFFYLYYYIYYADFS